METARLVKANAADGPVIWAMLQDAIAQRKADGSRQWQDGYPNERIVRADIAAGNAWLLVDQASRLGCATIIFGHEPAYDDIDGHWLTDGAYAVVHRVARVKDAIGRGVAARVLALAESLCLERGVGSIRLDTNFDNPAMLRTVEKLQYSYCGEVVYRGAPRRAYEKILGRADAAR